MLTSNGFERRTVEDILSGIDSRLRAGIDPAIDLSPDQPMGQVVGTVAADLGEAWEVLEAVYESQDPDEAEGVTLDSRAALTGTIRNPATSTIVLAEVTLFSNTTLTSGNQAAVVGHPDQVFILRDTFSNPGSLQATTTNTVWVAQTPGPLAVASGTLTEIVTPSAGWVSITNPAAGDTGEDIETDTDLRVRRVDEIFAVGGCGVDSLRADVLRVSGVEQCLVFQNEGTTTDSNGLPPHSVEVVMFDGLTSAAIISDLASVIWAGKPGGIKSYGTFSANTTDSLGATQTIFYSRATAKRVYVDADVNTTTGFVGITGVQTAVASVEDFQIGEDVVALKLRAGALNAGGVEDVPAFALAFVSSPTNSNNLTIGPREIAYVQAGDVAVTVV